MRIIGTFLLIAGIFLCISVIWATIGFLTVAAGLTCLLVAERQEGSSGPLFLLPSGKIESRCEPVLLDQPSMQAVVSMTPGQPAGASDPISPSKPVEPKPDLAERMQPSVTEPEPYQYDAESWGKLVAADPDLSRSVDVLAPFGRKYVDQLASAYLTFNDKGYLPTIMKMVGAAVRKDTGRDPPSAAIADNDQTMDLVSFALSRTRSSAVQALAIAPAVAKAASSLGSEAVPRAGAVRARADAVSPRSAANSATSRTRAVANDTEDLQELTDLLRRIA